jgi:hypothetical protein
VPPFFVPGRLDVRVAKHRSELDADTVFIDKQTAVILAQARMTGVLA